MPSVHLWPVHRCPVALAVATEPHYGMYAAAAGIVVEGLMWAGVFGWIRRDGARRGGHR